MDKWRPLATERIEGENRLAYKRRAARIAEIITGFRMGRFAPDMAEDMERELLALQNPQPD